MAINLTKLKTKVITISMSLDSNIETGEVIHSICLY